MAKAMVIGEVEEEKVVIAVVRSGIPIPEVAELVDIQAAAGMVAVAAAVPGA
jgi:D-ribose pyranose/furanose isomerase RbsD